MSRTPITNITRTPVLTDGEKFQTIASHNKEYEPYEVMGTYPSIEDARAHYQQDMEEQKVAGKGYQHFAIKKIVASLA